MKPVDTAYHYFLELQDLLHSLKTEKEILDRFERRREMAKHSQMNSEGFINRVTEGEDSILEKYQISIIKKELFNNFDIEEWKNNSILLEEYGLPIITWCIIEFEYKPYVLEIGNKKHLYIFHNPEDAVGAKLRWA